MLRGFTEARSIDPVPDSERRGTVWRQGPFWFAFNLQPVSLALGFVGPALGLSLARTVVASAAGLFVGNLFQAFHAIQGPFMVLPFFTGPAAVALGRVDVSFVMGLAVSATVYLVSARRAGVAR